MAPWKTLQNIVLGKKEQEYRDTFLSEDVNLARVINLILIVWVLSYVCLDYLVLETDPRFFFLLVERLAFAILSLVSFHHLKNIKDKQKFDQIMLIWGLALVIISFSTVVIHPGLNLQKIYSHFILVISFYLIIPNRIIFKVIPAITITFLDALFLIQNTTGTSALTFFNSTFYITIFLALNTIGLTVATRLERQRYHQYLIQRTLMLGQEQLKILATIDSLTGIHNRRSFFELAAVEFDRYERYGQVFSFMIIDVDNFKKINDTYSHTTGDKTLQSFANLLKTNKRIVDIFGRVGGDEFGILFPETEMADAIHLVQRFKESLHDLIVDTPKVNLQVNFSVGITEVKPEDKSFGHG